jgi:hypothetical protein
MSDQILTTTCSAILARLRPEGRTPMMRFTFHGWARRDYEALDARLILAEVRTSRYILPDDEGILVGSEGWSVGPLARR